MDLVLVLIACLISDPTSCKQFNIHFNGHATTPMQCMMVSMQELAKWKDQHPQYMPKKWKCLLQSQLYEDA